MDGRKEMGNRNEQLACRYLEQKGFRLVAANYSCKAGELDLVMEQNGLLIFVEVRSKSHSRYGEPLETVNEAKRKKLRRTASFFLHQRGWQERYACRFDVISIVQADGKTTLQWLPDAFR